MEETIRQLEKQLEEIEKQLEELENYEKMGYISNGYHYSWVDNCRVSDIFFHFKKEEELRKKKKKVKKNLRLRRKYLMKQS